MCPQEEPLVRPLMSDVVTTSSFLLLAPSDTVAVPPPEPNKHSQEANKSESDEEKYDNTFREHQNHGDEDSTNQQDIEVDEGHKHDRDTGGKDEDKRQR
ncbi:hypothetical protein NL676_030371 [Syzygium grande]|nr:hypothetical protein NL676_030371 [Syzygium grande]